MAICLRKGGAFMGYDYLLDLALILLSTKVLGLFSQRFRMPQVVGALVAGLLLGPAVLGIIEETNFLHTTASVGVIVIMFTSGMETDINELKRCGKSAFLVALAGVLLPLVGGFVVGYFFNDPTLLVNNTPGPQGTLFLQNIFLGIILTATSVSITVETLRELGFTVLPSKSNFIFITHPELPARKLFADLREAGILVRYFALPRIDNFLRVTIGSEEEMAEFCATMKRFVENVL